MSFTDFYNGARSQLLSPDKQPIPQTLHAGLHFENLARTMGRRPLTALDVRCDYLQQLAVLAAQGNISQTLLQQAYLSAYTTPIKVSAEQLISTANDELAQILQDTQRTMGILSSSLIAKYGLLNTVSIKLQDPNATLLFTYQEIHRRGLAVKKGSSPIFVFIPTQQSYFRRNDNLVKIADATPSEQLQLLSGELELVKNVQYRPNQYYDIERLRMSEHTRQLLLDTVATKPIGYQDLLQFARQLQNEQGVYLQVVEQPHSSMALRSLFDPNANKIYLAGHLPEQQKVWELMQRLSEAIIGATSSAPAPVQELEWRLVALQLSAKWEARTELSFISNTARVLESTHGKLGCSLEELVCKINRVTTFVTDGIRESGMAHEKEISAGHEQQPSKTVEAEQGDLLENFMQGIQ